MNIDVVVYKLNGGGAERVASNIANAWCEQGHSVRLITFRAPCEADYAVHSQVERLSIELSEEDRKSTKIVRVFKRFASLRTLLSKQNSDLIVAVQSNVAIELALFTIGLKVPVIGCEHNTPSKSVEGILWKKMRPLAYRFLTAVTTLTNDAAEELRPECGKTPLFVIPNALRLPLIENEPMIDPCTYVSKDELLLLALGRKTEAKGFDIMLDRFAKLVERQPKAFLAILGDGPLASDLDHQVEKLGLKNNIVMPGRAGNVSTWFSRADVFLMTSRWEGMPMVLLEAMGHGVVPVVTDFKDGPRDVIRPDIDGIILPQDDEEMWIEKMDQLLSDPGKREKLGNEAKQVQDRFGEKPVMRMWDDMFIKLGFVEEQIDPEPR